MPQPYAWLKLSNQGSVNVSPRAGHTITSTNFGFILYGGMDGRRNDQGNPSPNSDLYLLKIQGKGVYEWSMIELDPASGVPPARTLHSATCNGDEVVVFGGIHSATPYQCLNDGWILDTEALEWKRIQFKASVTGQKGAFARRMSGLIQDRPVPTQGQNALRRGSASYNRSASQRSKISFIDLAGAASSSRAMQNSGSKSMRMSQNPTSSKSSWANVLRNKMSKGAMARNSISAGAPAPEGGSKDAGGAAPATGAGAFHNDLVNVVSQGFGNNDMDGDQPVNVPTQRANHTLSLLQDSTVALFGGHGGSGYTRKAFNDTWLLNLDNNRWTCLVCQGNPPAARSGHSAFSKDGCLFVFGGWNNDSQFNDFFLLDVENKDWTDLDLNWSVPRWNHSMQLVEAIPSWRVFVFGGSADTAGAGRSLGIFDDRVGCLCLGEKYEWSDPPLENKPNDVRIPPREHSAICYDKEESRLIIFGGWANKWLDDVWQINVSSIVGPPYAVIHIKPHLGPVTGGQRVQISGIGFKATNGQVVVRFITPKYYAESQGTVVDDELIECNTPDVVATIGPKDCEVRLAIGVRDFTTTKVDYKYFLNTIADKSLCFGPGLQEDGQAGVPTRFMIQAINELGENRSSGADEFRIQIQKKVITDPEENKFTFEEIPFEFIDHDDGRYEVVYTMDEGECQIGVYLKCDNDKEQKIRGTPFHASFTDAAKNRANDYTGPLMNSFIVQTMKHLDEYSKTTDAGIHTKLKDGDVKGLIKIKNHIQETMDKELQLQLMQDEVFASLKHMEKEGIPSDKQFKLLRKIAESITTLKENCKIVEKEIAPIVQRESDIYQKKILEFEEELKTYNAGLKKEAYYFYKSGLELAYERCDNVDRQHGLFQGELDFLFHIASNFDYPGMLGNSKKTMVAIKEDVTSMRTLWEFEQYRIEKTEEFLMTRWGDIDATGMEDEIKALQKKLKEVKVDRKCDAYVGINDILVKWAKFCPLVQELLSPAMRDRHWQQLMSLTGKSVAVGPSILLRDMWNMELHKFADAVEETADQAKQESKMENMLQKLNECWSTIEFAFDPHKGTDIMLMKVKDEDFEMLEEHQVAVQNMFANRYLMTFETEVTTWQKTLANIAEVSTVLSEVQRSWSFLENLFIHSEEVKKELPEESDRFVGLDMDVKDLLNKGFGIKLCKEFCNEGGMFQKLEKVQTQLTMCEKALNEFMNGKRRAFPRFYFMSSDDLLNVLSNGNNPAKVVPQFPKFFNAIESYKLEYPDGEGAGKRPQAIGMTACIGIEYVPFPEPCPLLGKVEIYLDKCIEAFRYCLWWFCKRDMKTYIDLGCEQGGEARAKWLLDPDIGVKAGQCALLVDLITWVMLTERGFELHAAGNSNGVVEARDKQVKLVIDLIKLTMTDLTKPQRTRVMCMITLDAHNRDVQVRLVQENVTVPTAFQWVSMLKCYWDEEKDEARLRIADAAFPYGYEYLGNGPRLVVTPLTDRIYVTATQALHLCMGCAPAGPAGTGKTESTKDLANALAKACYVINAAPEMDYLTMGNVFKGLAASGSWGCFDEFNRLIPEVLSVCTVQFKAVCDAVKARAKRFILQGDEINLDPQVGVFITMNPGYLGRSELPEGLKALFRPITVMVPDFRLIMENMCMAEGFTEAGALGLKFSTLYALAADLLSKSNKYDWGMRAIKSVLVVAGGFKRADPDLPEQAVLMRSLRDTNEAKIEGDDLIIFMGLLADLFPGINVPRARDLKFEDIIVSAMEEEFGYTHDPDGYLLLKITQLVELLGIRHCIFLMGNPGSYKSALWKILAKAKARVGDKTTVVDFSPKAISTNELYGYVNMATREWKDGIFSKTMRDLGQIPDVQPKWIVLDGDLDANWIESMNSVMDDNRLLTLPSNERIPLKLHMKLIFEIRDLNYATPATATRAGIVCMSDTEGVQWRSYVNSWIQKLDNIFNAAVKDQLRKFFEKYIPESLMYLKKNCKIQVPMVDMAAICVLCNLLDSLVTTPAHTECLEYWFVFCSVFAIGGCLAEVDGVDYRKSFSTWWKNEMKVIKYPSKGTVFDFFIQEARLTEWSAILETIDYDSNTPMGQVTVPTTETIALSYIMKALIEVHSPIMLIGLAGGGKTQACNGLLKELDPEAFCSYSMNMNFYTDSTLLQTMMEIPLEKKAGRLYAPPGKLWMVYFIDDLNMPALDPYNTQTAIELMRQKQDYNHWYDRAKITLKDIGNTQYLSCMNPTAGSFIINPRLQRHYWTAAVPFPEQSALTAIYTTFMKGHYEKLPFKVAVQESITSIIKAALSLHSQVSSTFRKTAANFHYEFNIRHLAGVFDGMLQAKPTEFTDAEKVVLLWLHESERVYGDRLVSFADLKKYRGLAAELSKKMFNKFNFTKYFQDKNPEILVFVPFSQGLERMEDGVVYDKLNGITACQQLLNSALDQYNENNASMDLVLFEDAMKHVAKVTRIITKASGHALLVGVGGSGRQSLSRLSGYICLCTVTMIVISGQYGMNDLKTDLQAMYQKAGVKDEGVMFLFTDGQITNERFLVLLNDLLASGEIADLYANEDKDAIRNAVRGGCKAAGIIDSPDNLWSFFIARIKKNLHMSLCFSPVGDGMRNRSKKFPGLVNCTVIDWFQPWPYDALFDVGEKFLSPIEELGEADNPNRAGIVEFFPASFDISGKAAQKYGDYERRFAYATPKTFLEFIKLYSAKVVTAVSELLDKKERLSNGLEKLRVTSEAVALLEEDLKDKAVFVKDKAEKADAVAKTVGEEKAKVNIENEKAGVEAAKCEQISKAVSKQAADCNRDLAAAIPLVEQAEAALDVLQKKDFQELKALGKPPGGVDTVCEACMHLQANINPDIEVDKKGKIKDGSWKSAQKMMNNPEKFLESLKSFKNEIDEGNVAQMNIDAAKKTAASMGDDFTPDVIRKKSLAAAGLCEWILNIIMYYDVVVTVEPKKKALREAMETLEAANAKLAEVNELVATLQAQLAKLMAEYDSAMTEKEAVMAEAKKCQDKLDMAQRLINALSANGVIWEQTVLSVAEDLEIMPGEVLVGCAFASYLGVFTREYRESCTKEFKEYLVKKGVKLGKATDPLKILCTEADCAGWATQGLPSDRVSCENGAIMTNSQRWCLIIDPQLQGILWIKNKEANNNLQVTRMGHPKMVATFEVSLDTGKSVIIENMGEGVDAVLQPVIARNTIKRGKSRVIKLGDKEINFSPQFKLFLQTKLANPHYPPEIHAECTIINFTVTESGLEDQLLFLVVKLERPDLARMKATLVAQQNEFKVKLAELESLLLEKLAAAEGDILEDVDLILTLEDAKKTSDEVKEKFVIAQDTEAKINEISENYRPTAQKGALFFFLLMDLRKIHSFYKYSLDAFVVVVTRSVNSVLLRKPKEEKAAPVAKGGGGEGDEDDEDMDLPADEEEEASPTAGGDGDEDEGIIELSGKELVDRVILLSGIVTLFAFNYTRRGLLDCDKLTVATMLSMRMMVLTKQVTREEVDLLIRAPPDPNAKPMPESARSWLIESVWAQLQMLESLAVFKSVNGALTQNMEQDSLGWRRWYGEAKAESADLPRSFRDISAFYRLMLLRVLRPDRLAAALTQFVQDNLGNDFVEQEPFDMDKTYDESSCFSPFFFVLFPGTDPTPTIEALGRKFGITEANGKFVNISMGQGQEQVAVTALTKSAKEGGWVMLQNIHLMQNWLPTLERQLEIIEEFVSPDFRCILTSEPPSALYGPLQELCPESILQKCIKIADEAPADVKSNLRRAWSKFTQEHVDACLKPKEFKACLFALCFFHALISGRIKFGAQGWSRKYPFNDGDLTISATVLNNYMNDAHKQDNDVPWPDLRYIIGEIMYGGHITDFWDRRVNNTYLAVLIIPDLMSGGMNLAPSLKSPDSTKLDYVGYIKYIEEKFPPESPSLYGMHQNAEIGYLTEQGTKIFKTMLAIAGGGGGGGGGDISAVSPLITAFLEVTPVPLDMMEIRGKLPNELRSDPYVIVSFQESDRMNILLGELKRSLLELELGIAGALNVTEKMEALASALNVNKVYAGWEKLAYPSLKALGVWYPDLIKRVAQLNEWTTNIHLLRATWLPGLFNPNSFLTAIKQVTARQKSLPLDFMTNRSFFTNWHEIGDLPVEAPCGGVFIFGLFLEGASWEEGKGTDEGYIADSKMKELFVPMPVINCYSVHIDEMSWDSMYHCPVFITTLRGATFVYQANVRMDADDNELRWVLAGAAMMLTDD